MKSFMNYGSAKRYARRGRGVTSSRKIFASVTADRHVVRIRTVVSPRKFGLIIPANLARARFSKGHFFISTHNFSGMSDGHVPGAPELNAYIYITALAARVRIVLSASANTKQERNLLHRRVATDVYLR